MARTMLRSTAPSITTARVDKSNKQYISCPSKLVVVVVVTDRRRYWSSTSKERPAKRKEITTIIIKFALTILMTQQLQVFVKTASGSGIIVVSGAEMTGPPTPNTADQSWPQLKTTTTPKLSPMLVDTKYWIRNTEFGLKDNWLNGLKPCTLLERIKLDEQILISIGDSLDSLGGGLGESSNIRDLVLAFNGILLLEEDTFSEDPIDPMFIQFLNQSGDCTDSSGLEFDRNDKSAQYNGNNNYNQKQQNILFQFQPDSDDLSWFNPNNWISDLNEIEINDWIPESHSIPCSEDLIVFGNKQSSSSAVIELNERSKTLSFKVNFRPSQHSKQKIDSKINNLRISRLKIGNKFYNQQEFNQLIKSNEYENILFEFNNSLNILNWDYDYDNNTNYYYSLFEKNPLLIIDESSYQIDSSGIPVCLDEAGCLCGNEDENIMKAICSFNLPLNLNEQPCYDPLNSAGYCNKICATIIIITMEPTKFSEPLINNILNDNILLDFYNLNEVFVGSRRTYDNKYEITFRLMPYFNNYNGNYEYNFGREQQLAKIIYDKLNAPAIKSFYGIKSIYMKSSVNWKIGNRDKIFFISLAITLTLGVIVFIYQEVVYNERISPDSNCFELSIRRPLTWLINLIYLSIRNIRNNRDNINNSDNSIDDMTESFVRFNETINDHDREDTSNESNVAIQDVTMDSLTKIALINLDSEIN